MTDLERTVEFFRSLGIEPEVLRTLSDKDPDDATWVQLDAENFGGYVGFIIRFVFDDKGVFQRGAEHTGLWE